ncbi:unnamed protein product [Arctia plantaginis]|uniref:Glucose-methanol-choline oxidoreductase N-terminal domain-containing protein n=1 Tax=Arctia plantaginis TaxID=874455 RepID=A0A8S1BTR3_ARCPL|nr:unnamed protein product [Arctia plantaginis]
MNSFNSHISTPSRILLIAFLTAISWWIIFFAVNIILNNDFYTFPEGIQLKNGQKFDYIVVGAGAAGAAAAARLALAGQDVLLIEAGGDPTFISKIPAAAMALLGSNLDWNYRTISNNVSCLSSNGQQCRFSRGKCLGGSTSINFMIHTRSDRKDFDKITSPGWTYDDVMPYFLRYEGLQDLSQLPSSSRPFHNTTGPLQVGFFSNPQNVWHSRLIRAFKSLKFPFNPDVNAESRIGVTKVVGYVYKGERMSTARGYLARIDVKRKLGVAKNAMCTGVIINKKNISRGVTVVQGSENLKVYARKEVVLSAGTIGTPQILMLSGIGPAEHLKSMGIPVKVNLPVGDKMTDHVLQMLVIQIDAGTGTVHNIKLLASTFIEITKLLIAKRGAYTSNGLSDVSIFANTHCYDFKQRKLLNVSSNGSDCNVPNLQVINVYVEKNVFSLYKLLFKHTIDVCDDVMEQIIEANKKHAIILMCPVLLEPRSSGNVRLASKDPLVPPAIYPNYLADDRDVDDMVRSIGIVEQMVDSHIFKKRNASLLKLNFKGCPRYEMNPQDYWRCYVRHMTFAAYHAAGTAPLGKVLDARLRVLGIRGLRVADLSVLPSVPRFNTASIAVAIGERVADFLLEDNKKAL